MGTTHGRSIGPALLAGFAAWGLAACGGSGGGGAPGPRPEGSYHVVSLRRDVLGDKVRSLTGVYDADGEGTLHGVVAWEREGGALIGPSVPQDFAFTVDDARAISLTAASFPALDGRVTADGFLSALASQDAGADPAMLVMVRRRTSPTVGDLVGEWWAVVWSHDPLNASIDGLSSFGQVQVTPSGRLDYLTYTYNDGGLVDPFPVLFAPSTFSVAADGTVGLSAGAGVVARGGLSEDGGLLLLAAAEGVNPADATIVVLVRRGQTQDVSELAGDVGVYGFESTGTQFLCAFGTGSVPDVTGGSWTLEGNRDGTPIAASARPVDANVWVSGETRIELGATVVFRGASGRHGDYGVLGGGFLDTNFPGVFLWVR